MSRIVVTYSEPGKAQSVIETRVDSERGLVDLLASLKQKYATLLDHPIGVDLVAAHGDYLSVALGANESVIIYFSNEGAGETFTSLGDENAEGLFVVYFGQWTELSRKYVIPWIQAERVLIDWFRTGTRSSEIRWTTQVFPAT